MNVDDIKRFFVSKGIPDFCPCCGTRKWHISGYGEGSDPSNQVYLGLPYTINLQENSSSTSIDGGMSRTVITVTCSNCGYVRLHDRFAVQSWLMNGNAAAVGSL
jgi:hypothetical protein